MKETRPTNPTERAKAAAYKIGQCCLPAYTLQEPSHYRQDDAAAIIDAHFPAGSDELRNSLQDCVAFMKFAGLSGKPGQWQKCLEQGEQSLRSTAPSMEAELAQVLGECVLLPKGLILGTDWEIAPQIKSQMICTEGKACELLARYDARNEKLSESARDNQ